MTATGPQEQPDPPPLRSDSARHWTTPRPCLWRADLRGLWESPCWGRTVWGSRRWPWLLLGTWIGLRLWILKVKQSCAFRCGYISLQSLPEWDLTAALCPQGRVMCAWLLWMMRTAPSLSMTTGDRWAQQQPAPCSHNVAPLYSRTVCGVYITWILFIHMRSCQRASGLLSPQTLNKNRIESHQQKTLS